MSLSGQSRAYLHQCIVTQITLLLAFRCWRLPALRYSFVSEQFRKGGVAVTLHIRTVLRSACLLLAFSALAGCNSISSEDQRRRDEKTREEAAKATERIKPELKEAGKELGQAAREAAEDARAAAQGVREGWNRDHSHPLDLNTATESDLESLPGITKSDAERIIRNRPYRSKNELVNKRIISEESYERIRDDVTAD
jgi:hypothetical protein